MNCVADFVKVRPSQTNVIWTSVSDDGFISTAPRSESRHVGVFIHTYNMKECPNNELTLLLLFLTCFQKRPPTEKNWMWHINPCILSLKVSDCNSVRDLKPAVISQIHDICLLISHSDSHDHIYCHSPINVSEATVKLSITLWGGGQFLWDESVSK